MDAALLCVPTEEVLGKAQEFIQHGVPIVECATFHGEAFQYHQQAIKRLALRHKAAAIVGAGWDPGALSLLRALFMLLTPKGHTETTRRPGKSLHHTTVARAISGVKAALSTELHSRTGKRQRYVDIELEKEAELEKVKEAIRTDPLFLNEETFVFPGDSVAILEEEGQGVLMERWGATGHTEHQLLLFEARFSD
ncbi:hypothetical protein [Nitrosococcus wardiae]|uniref:hypothetical protein n=1 Tax=Nitrosococcus wardiae TaxID=1814290 RepID=UPI00197D6BA1|nr:hypothetical protein [Nitrosococcus wardiae]